MILTDKQEKGLNIAIERYRNKEKYTVISGYAGSGKSTLVKFIVAALGSCGIDPDTQVCYAAYTGKACQVLQKKGNPNVSTLHRLLYKSVPKPDGTFYRIKVTEIPYKVIIVDEVSMAPKELMSLLFSFPVHVICLGDPGQLPPINPDDDNHLLDHPHIFLDEIMRQAAESEIIRLSMDIREGRKIDFSNGKEVIVIPKQELVTGMYEWADQIICAKNETRTSINAHMRQLLGRGDKPEDGDKIICLRNEWEEIGSEGNPLVNGTIGYLKNCFLTERYIPRYLGFNKPSIEILSGDFISDSNEYYPSLDIDNQMILTGEGQLDWKIKYRLGKNPKTIDMVPKEFTYGYAITGHKSQGSEWDKVLLIEENFPFGKEEHKRWLYTGVTRAAEKLVLVR